MKQGFKEALFGSYGDRWALECRPYEYQGRNLLFVTIYTYEDRNVSERVNIAPAKFVRLLAELMAVEQLLKLRRATDRKGNAPFLGRIVDSQGSYVIEFQQTRANDGSFDEVVTLHDQRDLRENVPCLLEFDGVDFSEFISDGRKMIENLLSHQSKSEDLSSLSGSLAVPVMHAFANGR